MTAELLVELVTEEIPASFIRPALQSLADGVVGLLEGIEHGEVRTYATPRRLAVVVAGVAAGRPVSRRVVTGPPADRAFKDGAPTQAGIGFAKGKGVDPSALTVVEGPKGPVVAVEIEEGGEQTRDLVGAGLAGVITAIPFRKSMEWGTGGLRFARPLHRVNALYDGIVVPGAVHGIPFGNETIGHRLKHHEIEFVSEGEWLAGLRENAVEPDLRARELHIRNLLAEAAESLGCDAIVDAELLEEVLHLVEAPTLVIGRFDSELLDLPSRLLIKAMKAHQRYFPVFRGGRLSNEFVVISNNPWGKADAIAQGNANVLRARFHDAQFFFAEDKKKRLEAHGVHLEKMRWIKGLGTMAEKQARVAGLAAKLAPAFGAQEAVARRAGELCKCDLATQMVGEFPDLQGHMGHLYALAQGEGEAVAAAIEQHYQPAGADDSTASTAAGAALAVAERLDTLVGCFGIGMEPKGSGDPQGLRRAMLGIQRTLRDQNVRFELSDLFALGVDHFHASAAGFEGWEKARGADLRGRDELIGALVDFASARFKAQAVSEGASADLVQAVLDVGSTDGIDRQARLDALLAIAGSVDFLPIMHTFKRVLNITRGHDYPVPDPSALTEPAERVLAEATESAGVAVHQAVAALDYAKAFEQVLTLAGPVADFFDAVLVEAPDPAVKAVRMGLLLRVSSIFLELADFSKISTR
ncbi:MAG: glycine--tRNA ligase subunit beta [Alphaproteobacteria bacterium]|nr:glycine--tRNA ligase subunit beta [Alphaproteobacteria bacterium]